MEPAGVIRVAAFLWRPEAAYEVAASNGVAVHHYILRHRPQIPVTSNTMLHRVRFTLRRHRIDIAVLELVGLFFIYQPAFRAFWLFFIFLPARLTLYFTRRCCVAKNHQLEDVMHLSAVSHIVIKQNTNSITNSSFRKAQPAR